MRKRRGRIAPALLVAAAAAVTGCDLAEITVAEPASRVLAELYVVIRAEGPRVRAFLHRTTGTESPREVPGARIRLSWDDGPETELESLERSRCIAAGEIGGGVEVPEGEGSCYGLGGAALSGLGPGDDARVVIDLPDGGRLRGRTTIPGDFGLLGTPGEAARCRLAPDTPLPLSWTASNGAWAYATETLISGLEDALSGRDIEIPSDPLFLLGLSISANDTTIVYPRELGVFERFDLDRELSLVLQEGLPAGTSASVSVAALDRNYVNWVRGGNFNPSGQVRVPSLSGDGSGVFGSVVVRSFRVETEAGELEDCVSEPAARAYTRRTASRAQPSRRGSS